MAAVNTAELDPSLQVGSDRTACRLNKPVFLIYGDGGAARYDCFIDGTYIGEFRGDVYAKVYVQAPNPISDGPHIFTFKEVAPNPALATFPFNFSVDTQPPPPPVITSVIVGTFNASRAGYPIYVYGTSLPSIQIQVLTPPLGLGGAVASSTGTWYVHAGYRKSGTYNIAARTIDQAGNISSLSNTFSVVVGNPTPPPPPPITTTPSAPSLAASTASVRIAWTSNGDGGNPITSWKLYKNGVLYNTFGATTLFTVIVESGSYRVSAVSNVGEGPQSSALSVTL
jgi:hypothetical protein